MPALANFEQNLQYAQSLLGLAAAVDSLTTSALDLTDIHRASIVMGVSALDHYVHDRVRELLVARYQAGILGDDVLTKIHVPLKTVQEAITTLGSYDWLEAAIRAAHGYRTFQRASAISEAFGLVSSVRIWRHVGAALGMVSADVQRELNLIVDRRNKIAHEADLNPVTRLKWPMPRAFAENALSFLARVTRSLDTIS